MDHEFTATLFTTSPLERLALRLRPGPALATLALAAAALLLYRSTALWLWNAWTTDPYYTHGLLVAAVALVLAVLRLRRAAAPAREANVAELAGLPVAAGAYLAGFALHDVYLLAWSGWALLAAVAVATGGLPRLRAVAPPLLLLALALPVPFALDLGVALQQAAFWASSRALWVLGLSLTASLTTFNVGGLAFEVTPQCSGFQSALSLLAIGALIVALVPMTARRKALVLAAAVPLALALNVARILAVVAIGLRWGADAAEGFFHQWSSAAIFLVETVALLALAGAFARRRKSAPEVSALGPS